MNDRATARKSPSVPIEPSPPFRSPARWSRRRVLRLFAASGAGVLAALSGIGSRAVATERSVVRWNGQALGAEAEILVHHPDRDAALAAIESVRAEVTRLESVFSLARPDSALARLNAAGALDRPPEALRRLLETCREVHARTAGAFDPTVQPLWELYAGHFARPDAGAEGPSAEAIAQALQLVGLEKVESSARGLRFAVPGMALTLNGIAQGFLTDRAYAILEAGGLTHTLVDLGEYRALGTRPDGTSWGIGIADPGTPWRTIARIGLVPGRAVATSAGAGTPFDASLRHHHLFDPHSGRSAHGWASVSVVAPTATLADALSTALAVAPPPAAREILDRFPGTGALFYGVDGRITRMGLFL